MLTVAAISLLSQLAMQLALLSVSYFRTVVRS